MSDRIHEQTVAVMIATAVGVTGGAAGAYFALGRWQYGIVWIAIAVVNLGSVWYRASTTYSEGAINAHSQ